VALALLPLLTITTFAQAELEKRVKDLEDKASKLRVSGYIQSQFKNLEDGAYTATPGFPASRNALEIPRARLRATYSTDLFGYAFEIDARETNASNMIRDCFIEFKCPYTKFITLRAGITKVVMGHELLMSATDVFSPDLSRVIRTLIPGDRDVAAMVTFKAPKGHFLNPFALSVQLLNGYGINVPQSNMKNFAARLNYVETFGDFKLGVGAATYQGGVFQGHKAELEGGHYLSNVYTMEGNQFVLNNSADNFGKYATRAYYQCDLNVAYKSPLGLTSLGGEFWFGEQPGTVSSSTSPTNALPIGETYIRPFQSIIALLSHEITNTGLTVVGKYDVYNPNTGVSGNEIGHSAFTGAGDIAYTTIGAGLIYEPPIAKKNVRFTLWYNMVSNETTESITNTTRFKEDIKDNEFVLRMQVKF
jgi:hypothetical protein